jgi:hypothetical protein
MTAERRKNHFIGYQLKGGTRTQDLQRYGASMHYLDCHGFQAYSARRETFISNSVTNLSGRELGWARIKYHGAADLYQS